MNSYELSRNWFNFCFENPEKIKPVHSAMFFFIIEHCNRLGWKRKFGLPMEMTKDAIGISNYRTYSNTLNDLIKWGFVELIQKSKNQYSSTIIAIVKNTKANTKALDKAMIKHRQKQSSSIVHSTVCIDKQETINKEQINKELYSIFNDWLEYRKEIKKPIKAKKTLKSLINKFNSHSLAECTQVVSKSIENGWQGLFWDKLPKAKIKQDTKGKIKFRWQNDPSDLVRYIDKDIAKAHFANQFKGGYIPIILNK